MQQYRFKVLFANYSSKLFMSNAFPSFFINSQANRHCYRHNTIKKLKRNRSKRHQHVTPVIEFQSRTTNKILETKGTRRNSH